MDSPRGVVDAPLLGVFKARSGGGSVQPRLVEGVLAHARGVSSYEALRKLT